MAWMIPGFLAGGAGLLTSKKGREFLTGKEGKYKDLSTLTKEQQALHDQLVNAGMAEGAGGAFGSAADYYRNNLSDNPQDFDAFAAPELRRFNEDTIPGIAEQFAGMGSGALSSSGFRNAAVNAGADLSERLGAIRANLRQQSAAGLANIGQLGLNPVKENIYQTGSPGLLQQAAPGIANAAAQYFGAPPVFGGNNQPSGPANASPGRSSNTPINFNSNPGTFSANGPNMAIPSLSPNRNSIGGNKVGANRNPYTNQPSLAGSSGFQVPNFNNGMR